MELFPFAGATSHFQHLTLIHKYCELIGTFSISRIWSPMWPPDMVTIMLTSAPHRLN